MRFLIIASPRTGSSHLTDMLNHQEDILCSGEIFHPYRAYVRWPKSELTSEMRQSLRTLRKKDPVGFTEHVYSANRGRSHVGFKMVNNRNNLVLYRLLGDPSVFKIVLYRQNVLANQSSKLIAATTGEWARRGKKVGEPPPKILFEAARFIKFHNTYTGFYRNVLTELNKTNSPYRFLNYEEINDPYLFTGLVTAIRGETSPVRFLSRHRKQNSPDILSRYSNPDDVRQFLTEHGLMNWAYEGGTSLEPLGSAAVESTLTSDSEPDPEFDDEDYDMEGETERVAERP
jgi:hypothetical protein